MSLRDIILSLNDNQAILHYNVSSLEQIKAGVEAVRETRIPLIFGVSERERNYLNPKLVKIILDFYKAEYKLDGLIFLNADHTKSLESAILCLDIGYDEVLIDGSDLALEENIRITKAVVEKRNKEKKDTLIEGEVGFLPGESEIQQYVIIREENLTKPGEALRFVKETGIDLLAISIGNIHGITSFIPKLDFRRAKKIRELVKLPLVLHGASGLGIENIRKCINLGFKIIHINTEFRKNWKEKLKEKLNEKTLAPYRIYPSVIRSLKKRIIRYQQIFYGN